MRAPRLPRKKGTTLLEEQGETQAYDTLDVIDILEDQQNYFAESFEAGTKVPVGPYPHVISCIYIPMRRQNVWLVWFGRFKKTNE